MSNWVQEGVDWTPTDYTADQYDPTWPYNWKWGVSKDNQVSVWRAKGGTDGRPTHRAELTKLWGRPPKAGEGDVMGLAIYQPPEEKLDGTIVAPAIIKLQAYYGEPVPQSLYSWFEAHFPGVSIVDQQIIKPKLGTNDGKYAQSEDWGNYMGQSQNEFQKWQFDNKAGYTGKTIKFIFNEKEDPDLVMWEASGQDGSPVHGTVRMEYWGRPQQAGDYMGYADEYTTGIEVSGTARFPVYVLQRVKEELSKRYPNSNIDTSRIMTETDTPMFMDPSNVQIVSRAGLWLRRQLTKVPSTRPPGGSHSPPKASKVGGQVPTLPLQERLAGADKEGVMIAVYMPEDAGKELKQRGGEPIEDMHVTMIYFEQAAHERDDWDELHPIIQGIANKYPKMEGKINGFGIFYNDEDVLWAAPSLIGLADLRAELAQAVEDAGFPIGKEYDWMPHVTLKYEHKGKLPKLKDPIELSIPTLTMVKAEDRTEFEFSGEGFEKRATTGFAAALEEVGRLHQQGIVPDFALIGSVAAFARGMRVYETKDMDFVVLVDESQLYDLMERLQSQYSSGGTMFSVIIDGVEVQFFPTDIGPTYAAAMSSATPVEWGGQQVKVPQVEELIVLALDAASQSQQPEPLKYQQRVQALLPLADPARLDQLVSQLDTTGTWKSLLDQLQPRSVVDDGGLTPLARKLYEAKAQQRQTHAARSFEEKIKDLDDLREWTQGDKRLGGRDLSKTAMGLLGDLPEDLEFKLNMKDPDTLPADDYQDPGPLPVVEASAWIGTTLVGVIQMRGDNSIFNIDVEEGYRRRGVATALFDFLRENGYEPEHEWNRMTDDGEQWAQSEVERTAGWEEEPEPREQMTMARLEIKTTPELKQGDIVWDHGMKMLIDQPMRRSKSHPGNNTFYTQALVLNRDEVPDSVVNIGWTADWDRTQRTDAPRPHNGEHRWTIQGNELSRWSVEPEWNTPVRMERGSRRGS